MFVIRLQHLQWAGGLAVAACCLALGGVTLRSAYQDYALYDASVRELGRFHVVMAAVSAVSAERTPANIMMASPPERAAEAAAQLADRRAEVDRKIDAADRVLSSTVSAGAEGPFASVRTRLAAGRAEVDAVAARPPEDRSGSRFAKAIEAMFSAADAAESARDQVGREIIAAAPRVSTEIFLEMSASSLREHAGRFGSYAIMMLTLQTADDDVRLKQMSETAGRLTELRRVLLNGGHAYFPVGPVSDAIEAVESIYFGEGMPKALAAARLGARSDMSSAVDFTRAYVPSLRPSETLQDAVAAASRDKLLTLRDAASARVALSAALTTAVCLILLGIAVLFRRALFRPMMAARSQIVAIAQGDLSEPEPGVAMSEEIREMFEGLDALRSQQRQKLELEKDQLRMAQQLKTLSETDMLTGLLNRRALEELAGGTIEQSDREGFAVGVLLFDIDHFKSINDTYGHSVGDAVLKRIGRELPPRLRAGDRVARVGGEEFLALLPGVEAAEAVAMAERLRAAAARLEFAEAPRLSVTVSVGVTLRPARSGRSWDDVVSVADRGLYAAKRAGRNRVVIEDASEAASGDGSEAAA